jgi:hypothetical protein
MADFSSGNNIIKTDNIKGSSGELHFHLNKQEYGEGVESDNSYVQLSQIDGAGIKFMSGGRTRMDSPSDLSINANNNMFESVMGDKQIRIGRDLYTSIEGKTVIKIGKQGAQEKAASKALQDLSKAIHESAINEAKATNDDRIACPVCNQKTLVDNKSKVYIQVKKLLQIMEEVPYLNKFFKFMAGFTERFASFLSVKKHSAYMQKTKSCGSPGCKNNMVQSVAKTMQNFDKKASDKIKQNQDLINQHHTNLGQGGELIVNTKGGLVINTGLSKNTSQVYFEKGNHTFPTGLTQQQGGSPMIYTSKGAPPKVIHTAPIQLTEGDLYLNVSERFTVNAGSPGVLHQTTGEYKVQAGGVQVSAMDGEASFGSGNLTVVHGKAVKILADDKSGDSAIVLDANNVLVQKALSVVADLAVKGEVASDGPLSIPFINVPGMQQDVSESKPTQMATGGSNPSFMGAAMRNMSFAKDVVGKMLFPPTWILGADNLTSFTMEMYDLVMANLFSLFPDFRPAGWCLVTTIGYAACAVGGGPAWTVGTGGIGCPYLFCPVFLYYHNHDMFSMEHSGEVTVPLGNYYDLNEGVQAARSVAGPIATPSPVKSKIGRRPGNKGVPGPCGGGGLYTKDRNFEYGITSMNQLTGFNYVNRYTDFNLTSAAPLKPVENPEWTWWKYGIRPLSGTNVDNCIDDPACPPQT